MVPNVYLSEEKYCIRDRNAHLVVWNGASLQRKAHFSLIEFEFRLALGKSVRTRRDFFLLTSRSHAHIEEVVCSWQCAYGSRKYAVVVFFFVSNVLFRQEALWPCGSFSTAFRGH